MGQLSPKYRIVRGIEREIRSRFLVKVSELIARARTALTPHERCRYSEPTQQRDRGEANASR